MSSRTQDLYDAVYSWKDYPREARILRDVIASEGIPEGVEYLTERHDIGLFGDEDYQAAFAAAGLGAHHDKEGLMGRRAYITRWQ